MATISPLLRLTLQETNDNVDTWGVVLNSGTIELLEDSLGYTTVTLIASGETALNTDANTDNPPHYRRLIISIEGNPGGAADVIAPGQISAVDIAKAYLVANNTTGGHTIRFKTTGGGLGVTIPVGEAYWVYGDGTDIIAASVATAGSADTAALATDSNALGGVAAAGYALTGIQQSYTAGQSALRVVLTPAATIVTPDIALSTTFYSLWDGNNTLAAPLNPVNGSQFSIVIEQDSGGPHTITFASSTFIFENATAPTLSTGTGDIDYLGFEYVTDITGGARWVGSILKDLG